MPIVATNLKLEVENTLGSAITVTAVTKGTAPSCTATAHGLTAGDVIKFTVPNGMREMDGQVCRVASATTDAFVIDLDGFDTSDYADWESGTVQEVTAWYTVSQATDIDLPNASPTTLDGTTLLDRRSRAVYGRPGAIEGNVSIQHERASANGLAKIRAAKVSDVLAFRVTYDTNETSLFGGKTAYGGGRSLNNNAIATGVIPVSVTGEIIDYPAP